MNIQEKIISSALMLSLCCAPAFLTAADQKHEKKNKFSFEKHRHSSSSSSEKHHCKSCREPTPICHVPVVIEKSGKYCVERDLEYTGSNVAIIVNASNVTINFNNHSLFIDNPNATGILINNQSEVAIENDSITYLTRSSIAGTAAVKVLNSEKVSLDNLLIHNAFDGVFAQNSDDIRITRSRWTENFDADVLTSACKNITIDNCTSANTFADFTHAGMEFKDNTENVFLHNLNLFNTDIFVRDGRNVIAENINTVINDPNFIFSAFQVGSSAATTPWEQALVKNCNLAVLPGANTATSASTLLLARALGATVDNCVLECNTGGVEGNPSAVLAIGLNLPALQPQPQFSDSHNVRVVNSVIQNSGATQIGVFIAAPSDTPSSGIVIDNCDINGFILQNVFVEDTISSVISNSNITDGKGDGVFFDGNTVACSLIGNTISNNCGNGVTLGTGSTTCIVKANDLVHNGAGIVDSGTNNLQVDNVVFSNNLVCP